MTSVAAPLTVGTAGHIDHGKTELVRALTGVNTDRLPEERARGISLVLGYAPLRLPSGRTLSVIDVPGHERLIRTMVSGATGIDLALVALAADDGVMPQTIEHVRILRSLGVAHGVVAITKSDLADPGAAARAAAELLPGFEIVGCSARRGEGVAQVAAALDRAADAAADADGVEDRRGDADRVVLHIDRVFTVTGAGTVVTGTLWAGRITRGERLSLLPAQRPVRVRSLQVHDQSMPQAQAGQRVAVNLAGVSRGEVSPGDVLAAPGAPLRVTHHIQATLGLAAPLPDGTRLQVHHGTRDTAARARRRGDGWQLELERALIASVGDRLVLRQINPPDTLGGGQVTGLGRRRSTPYRSAPPAARTEPAPLGASVAPALTQAALALEQRLRAAGHEPPTEAELGDVAELLTALRAAGRTVRVGRSMHAHVDAVAAVRERVEAIISAEGSITLARLRDELGTSRRYAQALLEHLDAARVTRRREDDSRVLRRRTP
jgi:selenocysteine-specific elongation factor